MNFRLLVSTVLTLALAACAGSPGKVDVHDESVSLVYGYFDMSDAPSRLDWVSLKRYAAPGEKDGEGEYYRLAVKEGLFYHVGIRPGAYQVDRFGGMGGVPLLTRRPFEYDFGGKGRNRTATRIQRPGVYFLGAHRYVNHAGKGLFEADKFEMAPAKSPSEKELLQRLIPLLESDRELAGYTRQIERAKKRLSEL